MPTIYAALGARLLVVHGERPIPGARLDWSARETLTGYAFECIGASREAPERVFVGTVESGLGRSTDGGESWAGVGGFEERVTAVTVSPHDPDVVWAGTEPSNVYRSHDGGDSWELREGLTDLPSAGQWSFPPRPDTHHVRWIAVNPHDPAHLYVAIEAGAFVRSVDGGETWQDHPQGAPRDNHTLATHPGDSCRVYAAAGDGYAESPDCGESWVYPQNGLDHRYVWGLAVDPGDPGTVVVSAASGARHAHTSSTAESFVYRREAGPDRWRRAMDGLPDPEGTTRAVLAAGSAGEFYALTNRGLFRSSDGGRSWNRLGIDWPDRYESAVGTGLAVVD